MIMKTHYYLINGEIMKGGEMPLHVYSDHWDWFKSKMYLNSKDYLEWLSSLQPCEISESELDKVQTHLFDNNKPNNNPSNIYNVTDIVEEMESVSNIESYIIFKQPESDETNKCLCLKCSPIVFPNMRFNVCSICGNKRCPHASDHNYECTNSNDVGQTGSVYEKPKQVEESLQCEIASIIDVWKNDYNNNADSTFIGNIINLIEKQPKQVDSECEDVELKFTTQEMIEAVNYGFKYALESQHNNEFVPNGNILQWIMYKRNLLEVPKEFEIFKNR